MFLCFGLMADLWIKVASMTLLGLSTPAAVIDEARMMRNIALMQRRMTALGVRLRPHVKTSKCVEVARRQQAAGAGGITVSTLKEAEQFFAAGFADIFYAVSIPAQKLDRALALRRQGCALTILVDSVASALAAVAKGKREGHVFDVMIEVDTDGHRSGVTANGRELIDIGKMLVEGGAILKGVMTHAGSSYELDTPDALRQLAEQERRLCVQAAERLRAAGLPCPEVSVGSTPTALSATKLDGVTEVRAGVYVFFDLVMANIGICAQSDIALSVLTTVIGHQLEKGWAIVDAGWMAMSRDRGTQRQKQDFGYGLACDLDCNPIDGFALTAANQEHGILSRRDGAVDPDILNLFPMGTQLRILPNHACSTGAQFPHYQVLSAADASQTWNRFYGW
jgi:D-serine deaminase-like pyridoxal phosphate-dependent protein